LATVTRSFAARLESYGITFVADGNRIRIKNFPDVSLDDQRSRRNGFVGVSQVKLRTNQDGKAVVTIADTVETPTYLLRLRKSHYDAVAQDERGSKVFITFPSIPVSELLLVVSVIPLAK
jgi:hypothetical protein